MKKFRLVAMALLLAVCMLVCVACTETPETPVTYTITVNGGTADKATAEAGETITLTLGNVPQGKEFVAWKVNGKQIEGNTFEMPAANVTVEAVYKDATPVEQTYTVTVTGGTANKTTAKAGDTITLTLGTVPQGKKFVAWEVDGTAIEGNSFTMPAKNVTVVATYEDDDVVVEKYAITVTGGTADKSEAAEGETVTLTVGEVPTGKRFVAWEVNGVAIVGNTFEMPAEAVTVEATYVDVYAITVTGGTADKTEAAEGETVTLTLGTVPAGHEFSHWTVNGDQIEGSIFEMSAEAVEVVAVFTKINYTVTVTGGSADKETAQIGDVVTLTPDADTEDKAFAYWKVNGTRIEGNTYTMGAANIECEAVFIDLVQTIATPDNSEGKLIYKEPVEAIAFDRSGTTMFGAATDHVIFWIYFASDTSEAIGHLIFSNTNGAKITTSDGSQSVNVAGGVGNYYVDVNGNAVNGFHNLLKHELGYNYGEGIHYSFAAQIIAKKDKVLVEGIEVEFHDSAISEVGSNYIVKNTNKPSELVTITVLGEGAYINDDPECTTLKLGADNTVTLTAAPREGYLFEGWFEADDEGNKKGEVIKLDTVFEYIVKGNITLLASYVEESTVKKTPLPTPDNSQSKLIYKEGAGNSAIALDRAPQSMFTAETDHVLYYIYTSTDANTETGYIGQFILKPLYGADAGGGSAFVGKLESMDGTVVKEIVRGRVGDYYILTANELYDFLRLILGYKYSEGQPYYFAAQAIAAEGTIYTDSEISAIGSNSIVRDESKPAGFFTVKVLGDAKIDGELTEVQAGYGVVLTLTTEMPEGMDTFMGWRVVTLGDDEEETLGSTLSKDLTYNMAVTGDVILRPTFANSSELGATKLAAPDNSQDQMIKFKGATIEYDRQGQTAFVEGVAYLLYHMYDHTGVEVGRFKIYLDESNKGHICKMDGSEDLTLEGEPGNLYSTNGNYHNLIKSCVPGYNDSVNPYYYAVQAIADDSGNYLDSDIGAKGSGWTKI